MKSIASLLSGIPRPVLIFSVAHAALGLYLLVDLAFFMRCEDVPCPPGMSCLDGCQIIRTPWSDGTWPYLFAILAAFTLSSFLLLGGNRTARWVLLLAIFAFWVYSLYTGLDNIRISLESDMTPGVQRGWVGAWKWTFRHANPLFWLWVPAWIALDSWLLFGARLRRHFRVVA